MVSRLTATRRSGTANKILSAKEKEREKGKEPAKKRRKRYAFTPLLLLRFTHTYPLTQIWFTFFKLRLGLG